MTWDDDSEDTYTWLRQRLLLALVASLVIHALLYTGWRVGKAYGLWDHQATWLLHWKKKIPKIPQARARPPAPAPRVENKEIPLSFVEVTPEVAVTEPPKEAKFYGALNAVASNPDPKIEAPVPKADGTQNKIPRMADVPKQEAFPLQPTVPKPAEPKPEEMKAAPPKSEPPGDLAKVKTPDPPAPAPVKAEPAPEKAVMQTPPRPRTLEEARRQQGLTGERLRQEGGSQHRGKLSFDVKSTPFGSYDAAFIAAVQNAWYRVLDSGGYVHRSGKVVIQFRLTFEGRILDMKVQENEVGEILGLLCQRAIMDPAPFAPWPRDMRRTMGNERVVTFTFYYD